MGHPSKRHSRQLWRTAAQDSRDPVRMWEAAGRDASWLRPFLDSRQTRKVLSTEVDFSGLRTHQELSKVSRPIRPAFFRQEQGLYPLVTGHLLSPDSSLARFRGAPPLSKMTVKRLSASRYFWCLEIRSEDFLLRLGHNKHNATRVFVWFPTSGRFNLKKWHAQLPTSTIGF